MASVGVVSQFKACVCVCVSNIYDIHINAALATVGLVHLFATIILLISLSHPFGFIVKPMCITHQPSLLNIMDRQCTLFWKVIVWWQKVYQWTEREEERPQKKRMLPNNLIIMIYVWARLYLE